MAAYLVDNQLEAVLAQDSAKKQSDSQGGNNQGQGQGRGQKPNPAALRRTDRIRDGGMWE